MSQLGLFGKPVEKPLIHVFFDTETTGLPLNWGAPVSDLANWPRLVQIAWSVYENGQHIDAKDFIVKPEGFTIPDETARIHGITTSRALNEGVALKNVLTEFKNLVSGADVIVAHNISFDEKIIGAEFLRANIENVLALKKTVCTKEISTNFCAIMPANGRGGFKWPKLSELHLKLFGIEFKDSHNARADVDATAKCFWEMKQRNIV